SLSLHDALPIFEGIELPLVARELLAFGVDDLRGRVLDEALVREHPFRPGDLFSKTLDLGRCVAVAVLARADDRVEDAQLLALERNAHTAPAVHLRRFLDRRERARL